MLFILIKHAMVSPTGDGRHTFMGGKHAFSCMARTLAAAGHQVRLLTDASKATVMHGAMVGGYLGQLRYSSAVEGVITWQQQGLSNLTWHVSLRDHAESHAATLSNALAGIGVDDAAAVALPPTSQRLLEEATGIANSRAGSCNDGGGSGARQHVWLVLDADETQHTPAGDQQQAQQGQQQHQQQRQQRRQRQGTLMEALHKQFGRRLLMFVQNVHHLPFGACGTAAPMPGLLAAWAGVGGVLAVSAFVAEYVASGVQQVAGAPPNVMVVPLAAWGVFGQPPFTDFGERVLKVMQQQQQQQQCNHQQEDRQARMGLSGPQSQQQPVQAGPLSSLPHHQQHQDQQQEHLQQRPVVGMLKFTPEKGASLFLALAQQLPHLNFLAVGLHNVTQQLPGPLPPNLRLMPPQADVESVLQRMWVVLVPSLQQEAFGMVAVDAMLRGLPVIVSDSGGLPEAGLGVAQTASTWRLAAAVQQGARPAAEPAAQAADAPQAAGLLRSGDSAGQAPAEAVHVTRDDTAPWVAALEAVVGRGPEVYMQHSRAARTAALQYVASGPQHLQCLLASLDVQTGHVQ